MPPLVLDGFSLGLLYNDPTAGSVSTGILPLLTPTRETRYILIL
jgi:hypothetical protein